MPDLVNDDYMLTLMVKEMQMMRMDVGFKMKDGEPWLEVENGGTGEPLFGLPIAPEVLFNWITLMAQEKQQYHELGWCIDLLREKLS